jgi:hypothetical protein
MLTLGEELARYINLPKSPFLISSFLYVLFLSFFLSFLRFLSCYLSSFRCFLLSTFIALSFFFLLPSLSYLLFSAFVYSFFLSDLSENLCVSLPWFAAHSSVVGS